MPAKVASYVRTLRAGPDGEIAESSQSCYTRAAVFDFGRARVSDTLTSGIHRAALTGEFRIVGETSRTKAVVAEFGHQMSLRRGGRPRGLEI